MPVLGEIQLGRRKKSKISKKKVQDYIGKENVAPDFIPAACIGESCTRTDAQNSEAFIFSCRASELELLTDIVSNCIADKVPASIYISGPPGTGKTASINYVLDLFESQVNGVFINCMQIKRHSKFRSVLAESLNVTPSNLDKRVVSSKGKPIFLVLDELDHLDPTHHKTLYDVFEWPSAPSSRIILIGIANALDLTDRLYPRLSLLKVSPVLIHFKPYDKDQLVEIIENRYNNNTESMDPLAVQLCARKVAASSGDARKALDIWHHSIEVASSKKTNCLINKPSENETDDDIPIRVGINAVADVVKKVYISAPSSTNELPLHQRIALASLLRLRQSSAASQFQLASVFSSYNGLCSDRGIVPVSQNEFFNVCQLLASRGTLDISGKEFRNRKISLRTDVDSVKLLLKEDSIAV